MPVKGGGRGGGGSGGGSGGRDGGGGGGVKHHASPYNIPVIGEDNGVYGDYVGGGDGTVDDFEDGKHDLDYVSGPTADDHYQGNDYDNGRGAFDVGPSPFKYHHDVSPKGAVHEFDDQVWITQVVGGRVELCNEGGRPESKSASSSSPPL